jgi:hypothetical protein
MRGHGIGAHNVPFAFSPPRRPGAEFLAQVCGLFGENRGENNLGSFLKKLFRAGRRVSLAELVRLIDGAWVPRRLTGQV